MTDITIYGASLDLVEVEGAVREEYELDDPCSRIRLTAPDGASLDVVLWFDGEVGGVWTDIRPEDLLALLDAADERDKLVANPRDEYHTMEELYEYRMLYNALAANAMPDRAVKSWRHSDGEMCFGGGWFVVYLHLPTGQVSNHYKAEHWDLFRVPEVDIAPEWDGHTPAVAADRLRLALAAEKRGPDIAAALSIKAVDRD